MPARAVVCLRRHFFKIETKITHEHYKFREFDYVSQISKIKIVHGRFPHSNVVASIDSVLAGSRLLDLVQNKNFRRNFDEKT